MSCWKRYSRISGAAALLTARMSRACASSNAAFAFAVLSASTIRSRALALARFVSRSRAVSIWAWLVAISVLIAESVSRKLASSLFRSPSSCSLRNLSSYW